MKKRIAAWILALGFIFCFTASGRAGEQTLSAYEQYLQDGSFPSLKEHYQDTFLVGTAVPAELRSKQ